MKAPTSVSVFLSLLIFTTAWQNSTVFAEVFLVLDGPTGSDSRIEGTFRVSLDHTLSGSDEYDCYFDNALINIPIVGDGFVVSNVQVSNAEMSERDKAGMLFNHDGMPFVFWRRDFFDASGMRIKDGAISGELFSFDVHFEDGVTEGSYTIGHREVSSGWGATCFDEETPVIAVDGVYYDNWGGRTFSISDPFADFNRDGQVDIVDVNLLTAEADLSIGLATPSADANFDINGDNMVDTQDLDQWLMDAATINGLTSPYLKGDTNLDGDVDIWAMDGTGDAQVLTSNLGSTSGAVWEDGDFNGDGDVDVFAIDGSGDAQILTSNLGSLSSGDQAAFVPAVMTVPEPSAIAMLGVLALIGIGVFRNRRRGHIGPIAKRHQG